MIEQLINAIPTIVSVFCSSLLIFYLMKRETRNMIQELINDLFTSEKEGEPAKIDTFMRKIGEGLAISMRNSFAGQVSGDVRLNKAVDKAVGMDIMDTTGIGGILDILGMGNVKGMLAKNPATLGLVLQKVAPLISQYLGQQKGLNTKSSTNPFKVE